jgi:hypothetical protein
VTSSRSSLAGNTLHGAAITEEHVSVVVDQIEAGLVENGCSMRLRNSKTDGIGETLSERTGGDFNARSIVGLGMTGCDAVDLLRPGSVHDLVGVFGNGGQQLTRKFLRSSMLRA